MVPGGNHLVRKRFGVSRNPRWVLQTQTGIQFAHTLALLMHRVSRGPRSSMIWCVDDLAALAYPLGIAPPNRNPFRTHIGNNHDPRWVMNWCVSHLASIASPLSIANPNRNSNHTPWHYPCAFPGQTHEIILHRLWKKTLMFWLEGLCFKDAIMCFVVDIIILLMFTDCCLFFRVSKDFYWFSYLGFHIFHCLFFLFQIISLFLLFIYIDFLFVVCKQSHVSLS